MLINKSQTRSQERSEKAKENRRIPILYFDFNRIILTRNCDLYAFKLVELNIKKPPEGGLVKILLIFFKPLILY